ncbi:MAG: J domain-containing protein [Bacteroidetes bacterium]|nr:J domain-containing protein [Bacteroidota bacterium]
MTLNEAFEILKIDSEATEKEIKKAFHTLSLLYHTDRQPSHQDDEAQKKLNEAHEIAVAYRKWGHSLVPINVAKSISESIDTSLALIKYKSETETYIKKLETRKTIKVKEVKNILWIITGVFAIITYLGKELFPHINILTSFLSHLNLTSEGRAALINELKLIPIFTAGLALYFQLMQEKIKNKIEALNDKYQDKGICAEKLAELLEYSSLTIFNSEKLKFKNNEKKDSPIVLLLFGKITSEERLKILILKAKENGLIEPENSKVIKPESLYNYKIKFNPADFGSVKNDVTEEKINDLKVETIKVRFDKTKEKTSTLKTIKELKSDVKGSAGALILFLIITFCVIFFSVGYWKLIAILPGFFSLVFIITYFSHLQDYKFAKRKESQ